MQTFREFIEKKKSTAWKARKSEVLQFWQNLPPHLPISMEPVPENHQGTRFRQDGLRITGSPNFINSIICRLKDIIHFENESTRLDVEYRQIENPNGDSTPGTPEFVFYAHLVKKNEKTPKIKI